MELEVPVPGKLIEQTPYRDSAKDILSRVRELCGWGRPTFPGSQPVSLSITNIRQLANHAYVACEKTDGVRYLLYAASRLVFLIDRKETIQVLNLSLPLPGLPETEDGELICHQSTLLDGELVTDKLVDGSTRVSFLIYDAVSINRDATIGKQNLFERLKQVLLQVVRPRVDMETQRADLIDKEKAAKDYLPIYLKDFYEIWDILSIRNASKRLPHLSDGIIFTPVAVPYVAGTCRQLMKWKPPELNTLDFASELLYSLDIHGNHIPVAAKLLIGSKGFRRDSGCWMVLNKGHWGEMLKRHEEYQDCDGAIWECYFDPKATTLIPAQCENALEVAQKLEQWTAFWKKETVETAAAAGPATGPAGGGLDATAGKKHGPSDALKSRVKRLRKQQTLYDDIMIAEDMAVSNGFPEHACPYARVGTSGNNYFDFNQAITVEGGWVLERIRTDKLTPNDERVMVRVKESIDSGISFVALFDLILSYRTAGASPCCCSLQLPDYYSTHGTRLQHSGTAAHEEQQAQLLKDLQEPATETTAPAAGKLSRDIKMAVEEEPPKEKTLQRQSSSDSSSSSMSRMISESDDSDSV
ncbi:putative mRNA capping enzyme [Gregarina niphandrodes]|uniref:mRNA capping enzyme n=1 Tax=Gregarina niphandrodes TaxID=110365 RepID=A0A023B9B8_GRENI|nr:putative mRNA capping enzyme [Gregarina niphandrodes]EZG72707.1 putative mRNA capping enzyme [Gregarina niphandrodes]|eukprot:XP_011129765.1 putative mRNA capping enzyme [Gregarina niphandrodes]